MSSRSVLPATLMALAILAGCEDSTSGAHREAALPAGQGAASSTGATGGAESGTRNAGTGNAGTGNAGGGGELTLTEAVALWALADCERLFECGPTLHDSLFADAEACLLSAATRYAWMMTLPGTGFSMEQALACAETRATQSCDGYFSYLNPAACDPAGELPLGEPCVSGLQCSTKFCAGEGPCGTCAVAPEEGAPCTSNAGCGGGMRCSDQKTCARPAKLDLPCGPERPCDNWLFCDGTCKRYPATLGAACGEPGCDLRAGFICNDSTAKCASITLDARSCGWVSASSVVGCSGFRTCTMEGTCEAPPGLGEPCSTRCQYPLVCQEGTCTGLPAPDRCEP